MRAARQDPSAGQLRFDEDRSDVVRQALPRAFVGIYVLLQFLTATVYVWGGTDNAVSPYKDLIVFPLAMALVGLFCRFDIWAYRWGRRIHYEMDVDSLRVFRNGEQITQVSFDDVVDWCDARSPSLHFAWTGIPIYRSFPLGAVLERYDFIIRTPDGGRSRLSPPMLFRWQERGGVEEVSALLRQRLGPPINR